MSLVIRPAMCTDSATIMSMIRRLALYERLAHEVVASEADIEATLFGDAPRVFCDIAEWNGESVGFALWFYSYSTFLGRHGIYLEDLFVDEAVRGHGIGKALLVNLARRCLSEKLGRLEWSVLDWNEPSIAFYRQQGASVTGEWLRCRLTGETLSALADEG